MQTMEVNTMPDPTKAHVDDPTPLTATQTKARVQSSAAKSSSVTTGDRPYNFRLSQLSDSGAESGDAGDDQARLIRTASSRSHKFIIIPATGGNNTTSSTFTTSGSNIPFRSAISSASLTAAASGLGRSTTNTTTSRPSSGISQDGRHNTQRREVSSADLSNVKFSIDDYETEQMIDEKIAALTMHSQLQHPTPSSVGNPIQTMTYSNARLNATAMPVRTLTTAITTPALPSLTVGLRSRSDHSNSSMRSIVSAYGSGSRELNAHYQPLHHVTNQQLVPCPIVTDPDGMIIQPVKELSHSSSNIYIDPLANQIYSDITSVRSLASIGIGSTDGKKLVIRRVPNTPNELFNIVQPPVATAGIDDDDDDSFMDASDETAYLKPRRQHWGNKMQFVLACIGYSVGLGNVWRFPYMCYKSGGGVFLVPYCIILIICSIPLLFMELSVGQYTGRGPIGALGQLCPLFKGAGMASVIVSFLMSTYYSVIIGYSIHYFFTSFKSEMPWATCTNSWNSADCWVPQGNASASNTSRTSSEEFFENKVLKISGGIEFPGQMRWELFACLICAWLMVYFATWKSIKSSAKVRYFTATFPFLLIIILMGRAVTLKGADQGLRYFFRPNWDQLKEANVWINAASQNFNSLGITFGSMISFASYNKYNNNILRDTICVSVVNMLTSLLVGVFAFATLGNLAFEQNTEVHNVISDGPGMIFVVYPQAMAHMPYAQLWAVMFFFMLLCLGLNTQFAIVEVVVTSIQDGFPNWIKRNLGYHEVLVLIICVVSFLFGLPNLTQGGIYFFQLIDHYAASISIVFLAFCQMVAIAWFYGTGRLSKNVKQMTGKAPTLYLKSCWVLLGPCLLFAIWVLSMINYKEPTGRNGQHEKYKYPEWAYGIGWMFASLSLICIPALGIISVIRSTGDTFWERVSNALRPHIYECRICGEHHCEHDFPEQEQYMLEQEMKMVPNFNASITKPTITSFAGGPPLSPQLRRNPQVYSPSAPPQLATIVKRNAPPPPPPVAHEISENTPLQQQATTSSLGATAKTVH